MKKLLPLLLLLFVSFHLFSQIDGEVIKPYKGDFLLQHARIYTVSNGVLQDTDLLIQNGKIAAIGKNLPEGNHLLIDCTGKRIYPGFIDSGTSLGLVEVNSLPETQDYMELGKVTPQMQALTAVNPNAVAIPVTRVSGVTTVLTQPRGGYFPGTAALIQLNGYTPDQMDAGFRGVLMNFPSAAKAGNYDNRSAETIKKEAKKALDEIDALWEKATSYQAIQDKGGSVAYYPEMAQLAKVVTGEIPLLVEVNAAGDILRAIEWVKDKAVDPVFTGVAEGWKVAEKLAASEIPVITGPVLSLPSRQSDPYDASYTNASKLQQAGVKVAIRSQDSENVRNLPFHAGFAAAYGMGTEEALKAITLHPAEIFQVDDKLGSLEVGKSATLFLADGDPFEPKTQIEQVFIDGYKIPMTNRHIRLYQEFLDREMKPEN
ncbi:Imidazolonepropionase [Cyclobacterium xiamenense]|uniref:Imidazolonepropionase n=1 Tax=Cyclobacterium xiamenense TaxID=1297121 RepID=A0A1H6TX19_9BACT|nr:amidohydrolase family protein [Cyclobacterium xiamenense]SEI84561.1 Imidazolonepropionase [Cyclobacterium xiamenense]